MPTQSPVKITILWSALASYTYDLFAELARRGVRIQLVYFGVQEKDAPYQHFDLRCFEQVHVIQPGDDVTKRCEQWSPAVCLMVSWNYSNYRKTCRRLRNHLQTYVVSATDNQWLGTIRQWGGTLIAPWLLKPVIDAMIVPGDRQAGFMRRLGFARILTGWYAANDKRFNSESPVTSRRKAFLFVGRLVAEKGVTILLQAYRTYRERARDPWGLHIVGAGPLANVFESQPGITYRGFIQPENLPALLNEYRCLILPSLFEPWGVVVQEAALCGLVVITSPECGAGSYFVRHGLNGYICDATETEICAHLGQLEHMSDENWAAWSENSLRLGRSWVMMDLADLFVDEFIRQAHVPELQ
jgi:glycosyltransferase involved in cell wall biosynthesis